MCHAFLGMIIRENEMKNICALQESESANELIEHCLTFLQKSRLVL